MKQKLFHRDFTLMVLGQIASLFGNSILRFCLSLYVLDLTGSAAAFGGILAVSMIPTVLLSPIGGILSDRMNRRNIMTALDFTTSAFILLFMLFLGNTQNLFFIGLFMVLLSIIQSFYQPSVQSSIPLLACPDNLMKANGVVVQVNALSNLVGPILGGLFYGLFGLSPILTASCLCFFASAVMELFLHIPFVRQPRAGGFLASAAGDVKGAFHFLSKDNPGLLKLLFLLAALNLFLSSMITVGLPYLIKVFLGLSDLHYGFAEGALAAGAVIGGCLAGTISKKTDFFHGYRFLFLGALILLPIGAAVLTNTLPAVSYTAILICILLCMCCASLFNIFAQTFAQRQTPPTMLGKVTSFVTIICTCAFPIGQSMYGVLFDWFKNSVAVVVFFGCVMSLLVAVATRGNLKKLAAE